MTAATAWTHGHMATGPWSHPQFSPFLNVPEKTSLFNSHQFPSKSEKSLKFHIRNPSEIPITSINPDIFSLSGDAEEEERQDLHPHGRRPGPVDVRVIPSAHEAQDALLRAQPEAEIRIPRENLDLVDLGGPGKAEEMDTDVDETLWAFFNANPIKYPARDTRVTTTPKVSSWTKKVISVILVSKAWKDWWLAGWRGEQMERISRWSDLIFRWSSWIVFSGESCVGFCHWLAQ